MRRTTIGLLLGALTMTLTFMSLALGGAVSPASAEQCGWQTVGQSVKWVCSESGSGGDGGTDTGTGWTPPTEWTETRYVPTCDANAPEGGADALCGAAVNTCPDDAAIRFWTYTRTVYAEPGKPPTEWKMQPGTVCRGPNAPTEEVPTITREDVIQAAQALAPKATFAMQPATQSYVNIPNNFYATAPDRTVTVTLFGNAIPVQFTAGTVTWDFGDGSGATGTGIADAAVHQTGAVEHAYTVGGAYAVTVRTAYHVAFDLLGNHVETDLDGTTSAPQTLQVGEIQTLVTDAR